MQLPVQVGLGGAFRGELGAGDPRTRFHWPMTKATLFRSQETAISREMGENSLSL